MGILAKGGAPFLTKDLRDFLLIKQVLLTKGTPELTIIGLKMKQSIPAVVAMENNSIHPLEVQVAGLKDSGTLLEEEIEVEVIDLAVQPSFVNEEPYINRWIRRTAQ